MRYYVHRAQKPKDRAALALAVDVGSVAEEEDERGVAHLVEHLAFRATQNFGNFEIVRFLESIGAEFGPCQNAYTSMDETVYELLVPIDDAGSKNLTKALAVLSEFASRVRISDADVNDERGAVLEEMRMGRDARGRASEAYWKLLMKDSLYAERLPIGLESVIKKGNPAVFRKFYEKWYRPERMAVIAAGDFPDLDAVVNEIENAFGKCAPAPGQPHVNPATPRPPVAFHASPRVTCSVDKEHTKTTVTLTFKYPANPISTPGDFFQKTVEEAFKLALDNRLYKLMRKADPPFFSAGCSVEEATRTVSVFSAQIVCEEGKKSVVRGLEAGLRELARARVHGFSEQELKIARAKQIADAQQFFVERDQTYCTSLRDELAGHFLRGELVVGAEEEARMTIACVERMTVEDLRVFAQRCRLDASCVIRAMEGRATVKEADIAAAAAKIQDEENRGAIAKNGAFDVPETLVDAGRLPAPGGVVETTAFSKMGFNGLFARQRRARGDENDRLPGRPGARARVRQRRAERGSREAVPRRALRRHHRRRARDVRPAARDVVRRAGGQARRRRREDWDVLPPRRRGHEPDGHRGWSAAHVHALHSRCAFDARAGGAGSRTKNAGTSHSQSQPRPGERV
jgi:predicted Zn-dependent peptidase